MRSTSLNVEIWGAFLILLGAGLLVFNKKWAAWAAPLVPFPFTGKVLVGRFLTVVVAVMMILAGASAFLAPR